MPKSTIPKGAKMTTSDRIGYLTNEKEYLETKIKKLKSTKYPDKEQQDWYLKIFKHNLEQINKELEKYSGA